MMRNGLPERQERTWSPDTEVTLEGHLQRRNGTDALACKLAGLNVPKIPARSASTLPGIGVSDLCRAFPGGINWFQSSRPPVAGDQLAIASPRAAGDLRNRRRHRPAGPLPAGTGPTANLG